jgi:hypothetical protein
MPYLEYATAHTAYFPKLLGIYELECSPYIETAANEPLDRVVNVGAAEGYYAVGLARRMPTVPITAFEASPEARESLAALAGLNGVRDRIAILGLCDSPALQAALEGSISPLVICDIDGGEATILDVREVPGLARAWILVETHDCFIPGVHASLRASFAATHEITSIPSRQRRSSDFPIHNWLTRLAPSLHLATVISEYRQVGNQWLWMEPRANAR